MAEGLEEFRERGPRGEFVVLVEGAGTSSAAREAGAAASGEAGEEEVVKALREAVAGGESPSSAAKNVAQRLGVSRKLAYALSLRLADEQLVTETRL